MKSLEESNKIRRDIFSIKAWDTAVGNWCHEAMTTSKERAKQLKRDKQLEAMRSGRPNLVAIVHPRQWVVDGYLACGNKID